MSEMINCPDCGNEILSQMGTICPNCKYTVGYFNGEKRRKNYGRFFALTIFAPFFSIFTVIFAQINIYSFIAATILAIYLAYKSCPINFKDVFVTLFEKFFFWSVWIFMNSFLLILILNILSKRL
ncbi:hypothetical protein ABE179_08940 [Aliarcobacter skirrowii]|uniref:hypothetical protein n=1 Tax=Aliarcobacter skirrowii TaxID=28200 RepID=UPI00320B2FD3